MVEAKYENYWVGGDAPLYCPNHFKELFDEVQYGGALYNGGQIRDSKQLLTSSLVKWTLQDIHAGMNCSLGVAA